ncbi:binuclear zinc transcription factor [Dothidotthia symphoricarpi CBS 119687]|uniref:Binuclear zinc transcription factor n=1 Tax=Dothidotthia symphoricarpi CBS 119687 TaxID=1392245 RepID=A0A6A6AI00_9PLEO|nr:binuclear zinc transcription factor [Dothidotthia symphoricarpi CBS 119687]KAF2131430.1 binuclear zinc transcription factor [Dothidotthia symphoricarpi CBS 119687]
MPSGGSESPDESFFNDLTQSTLESNTTNDREMQQEDSTTKPKRIACVLCRKRKLRCDGARPTCATCNRLSHTCAYDEVRKKSGPKRGYVKLLEQRLQQVETLLKTQDVPDQSKDAPRQDPASAYVANTIQQALPNSNDYPNGTDKAPGPFSGADTSRAGSFQAGDTTTNTGEQYFPWEMISLGLEEPMPPQDVMDDLYQIYFAKIHPSAPIIHRPRFLAALNLAPHMRPPICLRYIMWTMAASATDKYAGMQDHFYQRARKYAQMDEMKGHGESTISVAHCQAWSLICQYEFKQMYFPRAWLSAGRGVRLAQMMQLHRLDGVGLDVKQCICPPKDWTEREERRRTFWFAFCIDRYASIGTGWPMIIDERDILTNLPASDDAFDKSKPAPTGSLDQVLSPNGAANLQPFGAIVLSAAMFGRNLLHLHRPGPDDRDEDLNGEFWNRHRNIEQILLQTSLGLPDHLRLPSAVSNPNVVFANMCIHTSVICLHQAAIFKVDKHQLPVHVSNESKTRCVTAAAEIASIMRMVSHMDLSALNPFISFSVYVAARVFVQYLKTRPNDQQMISTLQFLLQAMQALRRKNPLTESFLAQLDLDLESAGIEGLQRPYLPPNPMATTIPANYDAVECSSIFTVRETQNPNAPINQFNNGNPVPRSPDSMAQLASAQPGPPPFYLSKVNIDMNTLDTTYVPSQPGQQGTVPQTSSMGSNRFHSVAFGFNDTTDMDMLADRSSDQPSPSTINSQSKGGSTSHSSYSPGQQTEHHLPYRASPRPASGQLHATSQPTATNSYQDFSSSEAVFANAFSMPGNTNEIFPNTEFPVGMGSDWEFNAMSAGTGMTPMSNATWEQMMQNVNMGWDGLTMPPEEQQSHTG